MKNLTETFKYIFKNLIFVFGFALLPACFAGGFLKPFQIINFLVDYKNITVNNFGDILSPLFGMNWIDLINWVLGLILLIVIFSAFVGNLENHFRSGKLNLHSTFNFINNNLLAVTVYTTIFLISYALFKLVLGLIVFILHIMFGRLGLPPTILLQIIVCVVALVSLFFAGYLLAQLLLALADTNICGYSLSTSLSDANDLLNKKAFLTMFYIALPFLIIIPLIVCGNLFGFSIISNIVSFVIMFMYYPVLSYTMYFDYSRLARYDNVKRYYY